MPNKTIDTEADDMLLSALADGELSAAEVDRACALWRSDPVARELWHDYQLIGDVLRSEDLARSRAHDRALFERIRTELASQPVVLAPTIGRLQQHLHVNAGSGQQFSSRAQHSAWAWTAVMAGMLVVVGAWKLTREPLEDVGGLLAGGSSPAPMAVAASAAASRGGEQIAPVAPINTASVRDPKLDHYLVAHKQFSSVPVLGAPSGSLRQVAADVSDR